MANVRSAVVNERRKARDVYTRMTANNESLSRPRDLKQIRNASRAASGTTANTKTSNAADRDLFTPPLGGVYTPPVIWAHTP